MITPGVHVKDSDHLGDRTFNTQLDDYENRSSGHQHLRKIAKNNFDTLKKSIQKNINP